MKARVKAQASEGADKFGAANVAKRDIGVGFEKNSGVTRYDGGNAVRLKLFEGYFEKLASADTNEKKVLEQLVAINAKLAATNE